MTEDQIDHIYVEEIGRVGIKWKNKAFIQLKIVLQFQRNEKILFSNVNAKKSVLIVDFYTEIECKKIEGQSVT